MNYRTDFGKDQNKHVNYEPSFIGDLIEAQNPGKEFTPFIEGNLVRQSIPRENNFGQAGETYRRFSEWEKEELTSNLAANLVLCRKEIQNAHLSHFTKADADYGKRIREKLDKLTNSETHSEEAAQMAAELGIPSDPY